MQLSTGNIVIFSEKELYRSRTEQYCGTFLFYLLLFWQLSEAPGFAFPAAALHPGAGAVCEPLNDASRALSYLPAFSGSLSLMCPG